VPLSVLLARSTGSHRSTRDALRGPVRACRRTEALAEQLIDAPDDVVQVLQHDPARLARRPAADRGALRSSSVIALGLSRRTG
jgi:hypothetical protein